MKYWGIGAAAAAVLFLGIFYFFPLQTLASVLDPLVQTGVVLAFGLLVSALFSNYLNRFRNKWYLIPSVFMASSLILVFALSQLTSLFLIQASVFNTMNKRDSFNSSSLVLVGSDYVDGSTAPRPDSLTAITFSEATLHLSSFLRGETHSVVTGGTLAETYAGIEECAPYCELKDLAGRVHLESDQKLTSAGLFVSSDFASTVVASELGLGFVGTVQITMETVSDVSDNLGGVEIDVRNPIPVGGAWRDGGLQNIRYYIQPGKQILSGEDAKWYARARWGSSNEDRVTRQLELIEAIRAQYSDFEIGVAILMSDSVKTDLTRGELIDLLRQIG